MDQWEFLHITSSSEYHQSNGKAENTVRTIKKILLKCVASNQDVDLALLNWSSTPQEGTKLTPTQLMYGRKTNSLLISTPNQLNKTPNLTKFQEIVTKKKEK